MSDFDCEFEVREYLVDWLEWHNLQYEERGW